MSNEVLLLNADATPTSLLPVSSVSWQDAVRFMWLDAVDVLHTYDDWFVHSPTVTIQVPAVIMLRNHVINPRAWQVGGHAPPAHLVFLRDHFVCQYCVRQFPRKSLTIDHVQPRVFGGLTTWENVTTACEPCNVRRGCNQKIQPISPASRPTYGQLVRNMRRYPITVPHQTWKDYLGWDDEKVRVAHRNCSETMHENFDIGLSLSVFINY